MIRAGCRQTRHGGSGDRAASCAHVRKNRDIDERIRCRHNVTTDARLSATERVELRAGQMAIAVTKDRAFSNSPLFFGRGPDIASHDGTNGSLTPAISVTLFAQVPSDRQGWSSITGPERADAAVLFVGRDVVAV